MEKKEYLPKLILAKERIVNNPHKMSSVVLFSAIITFVVVSLNASAVLAGPQEKGATAYETHAGLFVRNDAFGEPEPLWDEQGAVSKPIFKWVDRADDLVGKTFHSKVYDESKGSRFVTTEDADGAKFGFDF